MIIIDNLGIFQPVYERDQESFIKVNKNIRDRDIWLRSIKYITTKEKGYDDYTYDTLEIYRLYFQINTGKGNGRQFNVSEDWTLVLQITINTYYRQDKDIAREIVESLKDYPIIDKDEVYGAFLYRRFYMPPDIKL